MMQMNYNTKKVLIAEINYKQMKAVDQNESV